PCGQHYVSEPVPKSAHPAGSSGAPFAVTTSLAPPRPLRNRGRTTTHTPTPRATSPTRLDNEPAGSTGCNTDNLDYPEPDEFKQPHERRASLCSHGHSTPRDTRTRSTARAPHQPVLIRSQHPAGHPHPVDRTSTPPACAHTVSATTAGVSRVRSWNPKPITAANTMPKPSHWVGDRDSPSTVTPTSAAVAGNASSASVARAAAVLRIP